MALSPFTFPIDAEEQQSVYWESTTDKRSQAGEEEEERGVKEGDEGTCSVVVLKSLDGMLRKKKLCSSICKNCLEI